MFSPRVVENSAMALDTTRPVLESVGDYDLVEKIAEGGMGAVYKARERASGKTVAVKIVPQHMTSNAVLMKRFEQEYNAASTLDHPNIVRALAFGYHGNLPYLVMEFVEGESLGARLEREQRLPEAEAKRIIAQVANGLQRAHKKGMVHRDVKPDNILLNSDGQAKLADLGLVKGLDSDLNLTRTGRGLGTPHFMAPEQFKKAKDADARCDIYSLAATLYMMVTGELPFKSSGPLEAYMKKMDNQLIPALELVPELSERTDWAIRRAMSSEASLRPGSCREFIEDLTGHSTRRLANTDTGTGAAQDLWYLVYKDDDGVLHTVKGSIVGIRRSLKEGLLGDASNVRASRTKSGPFEILRNHPEFRDLVVEPAPVTPPSVRKPIMAAAKPAPPPVAMPSLVKPAAAPLPAPPPSAGSGLLPLIDLGPSPPRRSSAPWVLIFLLTMAAGLVYLCWPLLRRIFL
jgi:eukaryotic-like serine/threonine-protein kinase